jgi:hypothetical protein
MGETGSCQASRFAFWGEEPSFDFCALGLGKSHTYENDCLHSLKAMSLEAKKDARLTPAATFAGADMLGLKVCFLAEAIRKGGRSGVLLGLA